MRERKIVFEIKKDFDNRKLIDYLLEYKVNKKFLNHIINEKKVILNNLVVKSGNVFLSKGDVITISLPVEDIQPFKYDVNILYEDEWIVAVKKPSNMLVHSDGQTTETLTNAVNYYFEKKKDICSAYPIHRLDYETTGIVVFAKNKFSLAYLSVAIEKHELQKEYVCLCEGFFSKCKGTIFAPIGKDRHSNKQIVISSGKEARSFYEVIENGKISKVKVVIEHGRKHQIRVHLAHIKHPIIGDKLYGNESSKSLKLHFKKVVLTHPYTKKQMEIICEEEF